LEEEEDDDEEEELEVAGVKAVGVGGGAALGLPSAPRADAPAGAAADNRSG
jgi:hypothetical protein